MDGPIGYSPNYFGDGEILLDLGNGARDPEFFQQYL